MMQSDRNTFWLNVGLDKLKFFQNFEHMNQNLNIDIETPTNLYSCLVTFIMFSEFDPSSGLFMLGSIFDIIYYNFFQIIECFEVKSNRVRSLLSLI